MLNSELHRKFLKALTAVPATATMDGRTALLAGLPHNVVSGLNRNNNAYTDLANMLIQLGQLGRLGDTGQNPLMIVAENALMQVEGTEIAKALTEIIGDLGQRGGGNAPSASQKPESEIPAHGGHDMPSPDASDFQNTVRSPEGGAGERIFISYAKEDYETARKLYRDLKIRGLNPWLDREDLLIGQKWRVAIRQAILESSHFLALLSSHSLSKRGFVQKELKMAMDLLDEMPDTEIFILPLLLDEQCKIPEGKLAAIHWGELFPSCYEAGLNQVLRVLMPGMSGQSASLGETSDDAEMLTPEEASDILRASPEYRLRSKPMTVSDEEFRKVFRLNDERRPLEYVKNDYEDNKDGTISDHATGLMWQQSGSGGILYKKTGEYVSKLNSDQFAGYDDWRLPTIDELMSLLEPEEQSNDLYISTLFDKEQRWCWSSDRRLSEGAWGVRFSYGLVYWHDDVNVYVRVVRS